MTAWKSRINRFGLGRVTGRGKKGNGKGEEAGLREARKGKEAGLRGGGRVVECRRYRGMCKMIARVAGKALQRGVDVYKAKKEVNRGEMLVCAEKSSKRAGMPSPSPSKPA